MSGHENGYSFFFYKKLLIRPSQAAIRREKKKRRKKKEMSGKIPNDNKYPPKTQK